jgi:hypothetical protein
MSLIEAILTSEKGHANSKSMEKFINLDPPSPAESWAAMLHDKGAELNQAFETLIKHAICKVEFLEVRKQALIAAKKSSEEKFNGLPAKRSRIEERVQDTQRKMELLKESLDQEQRNLDFTKSLILKHETKIEKSRRAVEETDDEIDTSTLTQPKPEKKAKVEVKVRPSIFESALPNSLTPLQVETNSSTSLFSSETKPAASKKATKTEAKSIITDQQDTKRTTFTIFTLRSQISAQISHLRNKQSEPDLQKSSLQRHRLKRTPRISRSFMTC